MQQKNYYIILGVAKTASAEEIKSAYRELAKKYHPDKNQENKAAEEYFKEIQQAYTVLSNHEKRRVYDLKSSGNFSQQQSRSQTQYTQYTGNAYQYAQQQAQQKQQFYTAKKSQEQKPDKSENYQILVSIGIALVLLYFIISYNTDKTSPPSVSLTEKINTPVAKNEDPVPLINDFDSPYTALFGEEISDAESKNCITIHNSETSESVVCLVENKIPNRTIRNQYMSYGATFKMNQIPNGEYFLKVYYGTTWDTTKTFLNAKIKGGFKNEIGFVTLNTNKDILKMKQEEAGTGKSFSSYEIEISPALNNKITKITAEEFFK